jgi:hypothetical protein
MILESFKINKIGLLIGGLPVLIFIFSGCDSNKETFSKIEGKKIEVKKEKTKIASCPTYYQRLKNSLDLSNYEVIATSSTAESLDLLKKDRVEAVIAGRILKPNEPKFNSIVLKEGCSFLAQKTQNIYLEDLSNYNFYTDLDLEIIKEKFSIDKIEKVENVYDYLEKGIIITSWKNNDYLKAEIIHLLEKNNTRVEFSRQATFYYKNKIKSDIIYDVEIIFN